MTGLITASGNIGGVTLSLPNGENESGFLARFAPSGEARWAKPLPPLGKGWPFRGAVAPFVATGADRIVVSSVLTGPQNFGTGTLTPVGKADAIVASFSEAGDALWAVQSSGRGVETGWRLAAACDGTIYSSGYFSREVAFRGGRLQRDGPDDPQVFDADLFLAAFDGNGTHRWTRAWPARIGAIHASPSGVVIGGFFSGSLHFDGDALVRVGAGSDAFLAALDRNGYALWAKQFHALNPPRQFFYPVVSQITQSPTGDVYVGLQLPVDTTVDGVTLTAGKNSSAAILRFDSGGRLTSQLAMASAGDAPAVGGLGATVDTVVTALSFTERVSVDGRTFDATNGSRVLIVSMDRGLAVQSTKLLGADGVNYLSGLTVDSGSRMVMTGGYATAITFAPGVTLSRPMNPMGSEIVPFLARLSLDLK